MDTALVIMAAGIGSRFGGGIKQLEPVGKNGEIIMDYSIHDAIEAGFSQIVFIIRKDIEEAFKEAIGERIEKICGKLNVGIKYAFQELDDLPKGIKANGERTKPWGTGQAVLCCKDIVKCPFVVINADDYYGKEAFVRVHKFLIDEEKRKENEYCMVGFILKNTLSDNGSVTRGICKMNDNYYLTDVEETSGIVKTADGAATEKGAIDADSLVSMNMWGLTPKFFKTLEKGFIEFFENIKGNEMKGEYLLPIYIGELLRKGEVEVKILPTNDKWFGVTYKEDKDTVTESFKRLIDEGVYKEELFSDLLNK